MKEKKKPEKEQGTVLRFERRLRHPPEKVWRALTDESEVEAWFPTAAEREKTITEYDPPRVLAYTWGDQMLRWELRPEEGGGSVLVFTTTKASATLARAA